MVFIMTNAKKTEIEIYTEAYNLGAADFFAGRRPGFKGASLDNTEAQGYCLGARDAIYKRVSDARAIECFETLVWSRDFAARHAA
jgi:hypothetical protein